MNNKSKITKQILFSALVYFLFIGALFDTYRTGKLLKGEYLLFILANLAQGNLYENKILSKVNAGLSMVLIVLVFFLVKG
jgi:hypothetical protein